MRIAPALAVTFLASALSGCAKAPSSFTDADRAAIRATVDSFTNAIKKGDYGTAASYYAENAVFMPPKASAVEGRGQIQKQFETFGRVSAFSQPIVEIDFRRPRLCASQRRSHIHSTEHDYADVRQGQGAHCHEKAGGR